jgi:hypothetical protein
MNAVMLEKRTLNSKVPLRKSKKTGNRLSKSSNPKVVNGVHSTYEAGSGKDMFVQFTL